MDLQKLKEFAKDFTQTHYGVDFYIPLKLNGRLTTSLGRFVRTPTKSVQIELSKRLLQYYDEDEILGILKHELIHFALFELGKPHLDGEELFEQELVKHGAPRTKRIGHRGKIHVYQCNSCGKELYRARKFREKKYVTVCCKAKITYLGEKVI